MNFKFKGRYQMSGLSATLEVESINIIEAKKYVKESQPTFQWKEIIIPQNQ